MASNDQITTLVGGGPVDPAVLKEAVSLSGQIVGVDGGTAHLHTAGITPNTILGDMDSVPPDLMWPGTPPKEITLTDQDTTDFEKALKHFGAGIYLAVGFTGGRSDHYLAVLDVMLRYPEHHVTLMDEFSISTIVPVGDTQIDLPTGTQISLMPLVPTDCLTSAGLRWPINGWSMAMGKAVSISNEVSQSPITLSFSDRAVLAQAPAKLGPSWSMTLARTN
ncbi:MAG: thiamine diphosphokinase [Alphaproteobacteria bacterium]|nr:thiamine diphosphokinase [Alphaproteobacteria bacterium SS10]